MRRITDFGLVDNAGPNHLRGFLKSQTISVRGIDIAVAFVTQRGLDAVLPSLKKASSIGPVRIITGLYHGFTDPQALALLLAQQHDTKGRLEIRISDNSHFHWKLYLLHRAKFSTAVIGSSNLTAEGLGQSGELNAVVKLPRSSSAFKLLNKQFDEEWHRAVSLSKERIDRYARARPRYVRHPAVPLKEILGTVRKREPLPHNVQDVHAPQYWRDLIVGNASDDAEEAINETTTWHEKGYFWYSSGEPRHRTGDQIIMFDFSDGWVRLIRVLDTTRSPTPTSDGRQFTAYKVVANSHRRRLDKHLLGKLISEGGLARRAEARCESPMQYRR